MKETNNLKKTVNECRGGGLGRLSLAFLTQPYLHILVYY